TCAGTGRRRRPRPGGARAGGGPRAGARRSGGTGGGAGGAGRGFAGRAGRSVPALLDSGSGGGSVAVRGRVAVRSSGRVRRRATPCVMEPSFPPPAAPVNDFPRAAARHGGETGRPALHSPLPLGVSSPERPVS